MLSSKRCRIWEWVTGKPLTSPLWDTMDCRSDRTWVFLGLGCSTTTLLLWISWSTELAIFYMSWVSYKESAGLNPMWKWEKVQKGGEPLPNKIGSAGNLNFKLSVPSSSVHPHHLFCFWKERSNRMSAWSCFHSLTSKIICQFAMFKVCELPPHTACLSN